MSKKLLSSISVVSPVYRGEELIGALWQRITESVGSITDDYEIILVNDCSPDKSWQAIEGICQKDPKVKGINLSRNFGQHSAITAGLSKAAKEWVVVMDCDLQDRPEEIPKMATKAAEGFKVVLARRAARKDTFLKRLFSASFYRVLGYLTGSQQDASIANFGVYHKDVIKKVLSLQESIRYFPTMIQWVGYKQVKVDVEHAPRSAGESSYNFKKMLLLALDIILAYSDKPLRLVVKLGVLISILSFLFAGFVVSNALSGNYQVLGYASLMASLWFLSGILIFIMGIIGLYLGKTFEQTKGRPSFIIAEALNTTDGTSES